MFPDKPVNYLPGLYPLTPNYRMKLTRLGHRFSRHEDTQPSTRSLARARLGLQLMRGRYPAVANP